MNMNLLFTLIIVFFLRSIPVVAAECVGFEKLKSWSDIRMHPIVPDRQKWKSEIDRKELRTYLVDLLEIIGFSEDSKIAYRYERSGTECDQCGVVNIQDLKTDKIIERVFYENQFTSKLRAPPFWLGFKESNKDEVLKNHKIKLNCPLRTKTFPLTYKGEKFQLEIKNEEVHLIKGSKRKSLGKIPESDEYFTAYVPKAVGIVLSPFEQKAAIVVGYRSRIHEGQSPEVLSMKVYGASMVTDFK